MSKYVTSRRKTKSKRLLKKIANKELDRTKVMLRINFVFYDKDILDNIKG